jgi:hypothetical protein
VLLAGVLQSLVDEPAHKTSIGDMGSWFK